MESSFLYCEMAVDLAEASPGTAGISRITMAMIRRPLIHRRRHPCFISFSLILHSFHCCILTTAVAYKCLYSYPLLPEGAMGEIREEMNTILPYRDD